MYRWRKLGRVFTVEGHGDRTHAQIPTVLVLPDRLRVYFATRTRPDLSLTTFVDLDRADPLRVIHVHERPILEAGEPGAFDEHGAMPSSVLEKDGAVWLYYGGWSRRVSVPYSNWTGLAISEDGGTSFRKAYPGPLFDRTPAEIFSATAVHVIRRGAQWLAWYASGVRWVEMNGKLEEVYRIRHARSKDGLTWERPNEELIPSLREHEPTHRPAVIELDGRWHLWFCHRGITDFRGGSESYRLGYATSSDGEMWSRDDAQAGMDVSPGEWDAEMIAYPYIVEVDGRVLMFYNGNGFGASGFGVAELER